MLFLLVHGTQIQIPTFIYRNQWIMYVSTCTVPKQNEVVVSTLMHDCIVKDVV